MTQLRFLIRAMNNPLAASSTITIAIWRQPDPNAGASSLERTRGNGQIWMPAPCDSDVVHSASMQDPLVRMAASS